MAELKESKVAEQKAGTRSNGNGTYFGTFFGLLIGPFVSGANFHYWTYTQIFGVVIGFAVVGGFVGRFFERVTSASDSSGYSGTDDIGDGDFSGFGGFDVSDSGSHHGGDSFGDFGGGHGD